MSEDIKASETQSSENVEAKIPAPNAPMEFQSKRDALIKQYRGQDVTAPSANEEGSDTDTDSQESESEAEAASQQSGSSSVSEESHKEKNEKPKGDITKALQIERERRKEANKRFNELYEQNEALKREFEALKSKPVQPLESTDEDQTDDLSLKVQRLESELKKYQQTDEQKAVTEKANAQATFIGTLNSELEAEGYPGFELALTKMNGVIAKLVAEGEYTASETHKADVLKEIYKEHLFEEIYPKFMKADKDRLMKEKKERKKRANLSSNPGVMPGRDEDDGTPPSQAQLTEGYLARRRKSSRDINNY